MQTLGSPVFGVRVSGGHLCEAEAPTEVVAETVAAVWLTEGLLEIEAYLQIKNYICKISAAVQIFAPSYEEGIFLDTAIPFIRPER